MVSRLLPGYRTTRYTRAAEFLRFLFKIMNFFLLFLISSPALIKTQAQFSTKKEVKYSKNVGDSFEIYTSIPPSFSGYSNYNVVYYFDANLRSGKELKKPYFNKSV